MDDQPLLGRHVCSTRSRTRRSPSCFAGGSPTRKPIFQADSGEQARERLGEAITRLHWSATTGRGGRSSTHRAQIRAELGFRETTREDEQDPPAR